MQLFLNIKIILSLSLSLSPSFLIAKIISPKEGMDKKAQLK